MSKSPNHDDNNDEEEQLEGEEITYEMMPGQRLNSKILWSIDEQQFYRKNTITKNGFCAYKCYEQECWARVLVDEKTGRAVKTQTNTFHNHGNKTTLYTELKLKNEIKKQCLAGASDCNVKEIFDKVVAGQPNCSLSFKKIERTLYKMRSRCQEDFLKAQKKPYRRGSYRVVHRRRRRPSEQASATTTDVSTLASDLDQSSSIGFETAEVDGDDNDVDDGDENTASNSGKMKSEQSEVDVLENIHFFNQSIDNLNDHLLMGAISKSAITMINEAAKRMKEFLQKLNGSGSKQDSDHDQDWVDDTSDKNGRDPKTQYDISVNMCQNDANRLMQNGHIFFNDGKLCFSTRKKKK